MNSKPIKVAEVKRVSQGCWGTREHWQNIEGNKGTLANFWEQGNKIRKITVRKNSDIRNREHYFGVGTWEHRAILEGNKGTRTPPGRPSVKDKRLLKATPMEREELILIIHIMYMPVVLEKALRNFRVCLRYYWAGLKALPCRIYKPSPIMR